MSKEIFLPTLPHWEFGNHWSGSCGSMRFFITTSDAEGADGEARRQMQVELWTQDVCRELAEVQETRSFACTQEGLDAMRAYLEERGEALGRAQ